MKMSARSLGITAIAVSCIVGAVVLFWALGGGNVVHVAPPGGPFQLVDVDGNRVTEADLKGRLNLVFFGYTHCPDICPTALAEISDVLDAMGDDVDKIRAWFISVDPERDTAAVLKDYLSSFNPHLKGLRGDEAETRKVISAYRVYARKVPMKDGDYAVDHSAMVYLIGRDGKFISAFNMKRSAVEAAADLKRRLGAD
ncbi:MAG: SCO family protein [Alphaproteobacteria bacterium]|nr:SCO family protein [Alphaproteobacteria bacterium]